MNVLAPGNRFANRFTARQASTLFLISLLSAVCFRRFVVESSDPYKCYALMQEGQWSKDNKWLTPGCVSENYGSQAVHECMQKKKISIIGDEYMQGLYWALRQKLDSKTSVSPAGHDVHHIDNGLELEFLWDPYQNRSDISEHFNAFRAEDKTRPAVLVIGSPRRLAEQGGMEEYTGRLDSIIGLIKPPKSFANRGFLNFHREDGPGDLLLFAPIQEPLSKQPAKSTLAHHAMNEELKKKAKRYDLDVLWSFNRMSAGQEDKYLEDGETPIPAIVKRQANLLISLRCTARFSQTRGFPCQRSCCGTWKARNWIQNGFLLMGMAILPLILVLDRVRPTLREYRRPVLHAFAAFAAAVSLNYLADRTHLFEQVHRLELVPDDLRAMLLVASLVGFVTIRPSLSREKLSMREKQPDQPFLSRDQTNEMKGWMQLAICIYHYNKAWTADWYWEIIRVCVAAYLFLTGFGHTVYFLRTGDFAFKRVVAVMLRTNLLAVSLAYVMRTRWLLYYYMPLSSFWYLVVYSTLAIRNKYNVHRTFVILKILASSYLVRTFINTPDLAETVVRLFTIVFRMSFDGKEFFHHRVHMDQYIVYIGMLTAIFYIWAVDALGADGANAFVNRMFRRYFFSLKIVTIAVSAIAFVSFWYWANVQLQSQQKWTENQPYVTWIPILAFLVLRNAHVSSRNFISYGFAWLGRYSGEMYVMQNHLWLAGDQEAVLRTGLFRGNETVVGDRWRDLLLSTPLFLIVCCAVGDSTSTIVAWFTKESAAQTSTHASTTSSAGSEEEMGLLHGTHRVAEERLPLPRWRRVMSILPETLWPHRIEYRALMLLVVLWLLNLAYT